MIKKIKCYFDVASMFPPNQTDIPSNKEAYGTYLKMAWPCIMEALFLALVNMIDTMMVGGLGKNAVAAVGITNQPKYILLVLVTSLNIGITAVVARRKGEEKQEDANQILKGILVLAIIIGMMMSLVGICFANPILEFAGAEIEYLEDAVLYMKIISVGIFFQTMNLVINAAQRGSGNTKITMRTNIIANIINIIFNYLLIGGKLGFPAWGVKGAAVATTLGYFIACIVAMGTLFSKTGYLNIYMAYKKRITITSLKSIFQVSSSAFVEQMFLRIGFMMYAIIVAKLGTVQYATHLICTTISSLSFCFGDGLAIPASALVGQMLGAKKLEHAKMYREIGQRMAFLVSTGLVFIFIFGRQWLMGLFSQDPEIIIIGGNLLLILALTTHVQTSQIVSNGCLRGAGDSKYVAIVALVSAVLVRPIIAYILCILFRMGVYGAWISVIIDQAFRVILASARLRGDKWYQIKL